MRVGWRISCSLPLVPRNRAEDPTIFLGWRKGPEIFLGPLLPHQTSRGREKVSGKLMVWSGDSPAAQITCNTGFMAFSPVPLSGLSNLPMRAWLLGFQLWQCPLSPSPLLSLREISRVKKQLRYSSPRCGGTLSKAFIPFLENRCTLDISFSFLCQEPR